MVEKFNNLNRAGKLYLAADLIIAVAFILLPFISIFGLINGPALLLPFSLIRLYSQGMNMVNNAASDDMFGSMVNEAIGGFIAQSSGTFILVIVLTFVFYVVLVLSVLAIYFFYKNRKDRFIHFSLYSCISALVVTVLVWLVRVILISRISSAMTSLTGGFGAGLVSTASGSFFSFGFGFYVLFLAGICGIIAWFIPSFKSEIAAAGQVTDREINRSLNNQDTFTSKKITEPAKTEYPETYRPAERVELPSPGLNYLPEVMAKKAVSFNGTNITTDQFPLIFGGTADSDVRTDWMGPESSFEIVLYEESPLIVADSNNIRLNGELLVPGNFYRLMDKDIINVDSHDIKIDFTGF